MKVKDKVFRYTIKLDFSNDKVEKNRKEYEIIGYNDTNLAINDSSFSTIRHTKMYRSDNTVLFNAISVYDTSGWAISSYDYIQADLYTQSSSEKIAYKRIKKALEKFIYKKHGRYCNAISFLDRIEV